MCMLAQDNEEFFCFLLWFANTLILGLQWLHLSYTAVH